MSEDADEADRWRALLAPLARAQDALARLEAAAASESVRDGLLARLALAGAAGFLAHHGALVGAADLAPRDAGLVGAWRPLALGGDAARLAQAMPATAGAAGGLGAPFVGDDADAPLPPDNRLVGHALLLARHWRALADPDAPLADGGDPGRDALWRALAALGRGGAVDDEA